MLALALHARRARWALARTLRALGMVHFELKNYVDCARFLSDALGSSERSLEADKRDKTEKLLSRARGYIARLTLDIEPETRVTVDGRNTDLSSGSELALNGGEHQLEFRAPGRITDRRTLRLEGGKHETLRVQLAEVGAVSSAAGGGDRRDARPVYKSPWLWTALGVVVAGAAAGTAIALTRKTETRTEPLELGTTGEPPLRGSIR